MYNYYTDQVFTIDIFLLVVSLFLAFLILLYMLVKEYAEKRYRRRLWEIKKNIYALVLAGGKPSSQVYLPFAADSTPRDFLYVEKNRARDAVFFNMAEQKIFKECFVAPERIKKIENEALRGRDKWQRIEAILCLGYAGVDSALGVLKKIILDKDEDVSYFSIIALGQIKTVESAEILIKFLKKNKTARYKIISVLDNFPHDIAREVIKLMEDKDHDVRLWALKLLTRLGARNYAQTIEKLTHDPSDGVRAAACECLGKSGEKTVALPVAKCLSDESWLVRANAVKALSELLKEASLEKIMPLINDASLSVINSVRDVIVTHIEAALPYLKEIFAGQDELAKRISVEALEISGYLTQLLCDLLRDDNSRKKQARIILEGIIRSHIHVGLIAAILEFQENQRERLMNELRGFEESFTAEIEKRIEDK